MKQTPPVVKNQDLDLIIDALSLEGQGIGRVDGYAVFVPGALPGETVRVHIVKVQPNFAFGKLLSVTEASKDRVAPACSAYPACGGCVLQHLAYPAQLAMKQQSVLDALTRIGGFSDVPMRPILGMRDPWRYRNKGSFPFAGAGAGAAFGFFAPRSHRLIPLSDCPIQSKRIMDVVQHVEEWANTCRISAYNEETKRGILRHVMVRETVSGGVMAVIVTTTDKLPHRDALLTLLSDVDSVWQNVNAADTNVIFGSDFRLVAGAPALTETVAGLSFSVSPQSFLQVNAAQTAVLYQAAVELLAPRPDETVVDAYCGIGTISLLLAQSAGRVIGIELVEAAVADAKENAKRNGLANAEFLTGAVEDVLPRLVADGTQLSAVAIDPPRKGCEPAVLDAIAASGVSRMVYVSCAPATLARDAKLLSEHGFVLSAVQPVDMFPHTGHVETVVLMSRVNK